MDAGVKKNWVKALKSGKYKKAKLTLREGDKFCVFGVLCDVYKDTKAPDSKWGEHPGTERMDFRTGRTNTSLGGLCFGAPPQEVLDWAGLSWNEFIMVRNANDHGSGKKKDLNFKDLAKIIERL